MTSRLLFLIVLLLTGGHSAAAETLEELLLAEPLAKLAADTRQSGDAARGAA